MEKLCFFCNEIFDVPEMEKCKCNNFACKFCFMKCLKCEEIVCSDCKNSHNHNIISATKNVVQK